MTKGVVSGGGWPPSPAYNVEPVTNTSLSSCENNGDGRPREWSARSTPSVAALFYTLRDSYCLQHCRTVCSVCSDIRSESRFLPTAPAFDAPVREVPVGISPSRLAWKKTRMAWLPDGEKISKISLFVLAQLTNVTDRRTDTACRTLAIAALMHSIERQKLRLKMCIMTGRCTATR